MKYLYTFLYKLFSISTFFIFLIHVRVTHTHKFIISVNKINEDKDNLITYDQYTMRNSEVIVYGVLWNTEAHKDYNSALSLS